MKNPIQIQTAYFFIAMAGLLASVALAPADKKTSWAHGRRRSRRFRCGQDRSGTIVEVSWRLNDYVSHVGNEEQVRPKVSDLAFAIVG